MLVCCRSYGALLGNWSEINYNSLIQAILGKAPLEIDILNLFLDFSTANMYVAPARSDDKSSAIHGRPIPAPG